MKLGIGWRRRSVVVGLGVALGGSLLGGLAHGAPNCPANQQVKITGGYENRTASLFGEVPVSGAMERLTAQAQRRCKQKTTELGIGRLVPRLLDLDLNVGYGRAARPDAAVRAAEESPGRAIAGQWPAKFRFSGSATYCCVEAQ